jgi:uncharacterized protein YndB with AHSA1/START domain
MPNIQVQAHFDASSDRVWALLADPTRMGEWSPECRSVTWARKGTTPAVGARFKGHNRNGWRRWTTTGTIATYEPGRNIAWDVNMGPLPVSQWGYRIDADPTGSGCTVTESFTDKRGLLIKGLGGPARGVTDTEGHNRQMMEETLARMKAAAESATTGA